MKKGEQRRKITGDPFGDPLIFLFFLVLLKLYVKMGIILYHNKHTLDKNKLIRLGVIDGEKETDTEDSGETAI